jgi:hypothetical protein
MSDAPRARPGLYARGEAKARATVTQVGSGLMAFMLGGLLVSDLAVGLLAWVASLDRPMVAFVVGWALSRVWLWLVLPALGWVAGRFLGAAPERFALVAGLSGELFGILVASAGGGLEMVFLDWVDGAARIVTLAAGLWLTGLAVKKGREGAAAAQEKAEAIAARQAAEYAEVVARAKGESPPPADPPPG